MMSAFKGGAHILKILGWANGGLLKVSHLFDVECKGKSSDKGMTITLASIVEYQRNPFIAHENLGPLTRKKNLGLLV